MTAPAALRLTRIEELFCRGFSFDRLTELGADEGWTRDDVLTVLRLRQWDLDAAGRLPRSKRVTSPLGLRNLLGTPMPVQPAARPTSDDRVGADNGVRQHGRRTTSSPAPPIVEESTVQVLAEPPAQTGPAPGRRPTRRQPINHGTNSGYESHRKRKEPIAAADPCGCLAAHRAYVANWAAAKKQSSASIQPAAAPSVAIPRDLAQWLTDASTSPVRAVRRSASAAAHLLEQLLDALDDLARAERTRAHQIAGAEA